LEPWRLRAGATADNTSRNKLASLRVRLEEGEAWNHVPDSRLRNHTQLVALGNPMGRRATSLRYGADSARRRKRREECRQRLTCVTFRGTAVEHSDRNEREHSVEDDARQAADGDAAASLQWR